MARSKERAYRSIAFPLHTGKQSRLTISGAKGIRPTLITDGMETPLEDSDFPPPSKPGK